MASGRSSVKARAKRITEAPVDVETPARVMKGVTRSKVQVRRDGALIMEWHCVGYSMPQIEKKIGLVTLDEGYVLDREQIYRVIEEGLQELAGKVEISAHAHRAMMLYRFGRRRSQIEDEVERAAAPAVETQVRKRDIAGSGTKEAKMPVAGYTESTRKEKGRLVPATYFEQLNAIDKLEMDLLGLQLPKQLPEEANEARAFAEVDGDINYQETARLMIDATLGLAAPKDGPAYAPMTVEDEEG